MKNILDIIYEYSKKFHLLDETAINKILDELFRLNGFTDYSYEVITDKTRFISDLGALDGKDMYIYLPNLKKKIKKEDYMIDSDLETTIPLFERFLRMNCEILLTCLHECEHCIQDIQMKDYNDDTLEKKLIRIEDDYLSKAEGQFLFYDNIDRALNIIPSYFTYVKLKRKYEKNYSISLLERLANIHSYEKIISMLNEIKGELTKLLELMDQVLFTTKMSTYETKWGPTLLFFEHLGYYDEVDYYDQLELPYEDRFTYGLNLTGDEFEDNIERLQLFKK